MPKRRSGRSVPKRAIASSWEIRGIGSSTSMPATPSTWAISRSLASITSSTSTNDISMSSWVKSGWRSARRSSSRKQRAIW